MADIRDVDRSLSSEPRLAAAENLWGDQEAQIRRVRQFTYGRLAAATVGLVGLIVVWSINGSRWASLTALVVLLPISVQFAALRFLTRGEVTRAVVLTAIANWAIVLLLSYTLAPVFIGFGVVLTWPILQAISFVDRRTLRRISIVTVPVAMLCVAFALRGDPAGLADSLGSRWLSIGTFVTGAVMYPLTFGLIWQYYGRLEEAVSDLRVSNLALQESERELEHKVEQRTEQLAEASAYVSSVIANLEQGLVAIGLNGEIGRTNAAFIDMFGRTARTEVPDVLTPLLDGRAGDPDTASEFVPISRSRVGKAVATPLRVTADDGSISVVGTIVVVDDVTVEREVDRMKTDFISLVSHELRTPLTSIIGFAKMVDRRLDNRVYPHVDQTTPRVEKAIAQIRSNLAIIESEGARLTSLINDVLDIAKMEAGGIEWNFAAGRLEPVIEAAVSATASLFDGSTVAISVDVVDELPAVSIDHQRMVQVFINLISNARKFTDSGEVQISAWHSGADVFVAVHDSGIGVAEIDLPRLFDRFHQVGDSLTDRPTGTGLGLPICAEIVEAHGGRIEVESTLGSGSTFTVVLPIVVEG